MTKQKWTVTVEDKQYAVEYACSPLFGKTVLTVDKDKFTVKGKPFGIGIERREMIIVGGMQAILDVKKNGRASLICREADVNEIK